MKIKDFFYAVLLAIVSLLLVSDLFFNAGRQLTFDGAIHMTTMAQFARALSAGDFPVVWTTGFANYGFPLSLFAHQVTAYGGGILVLLTNDPVLSYTLLFAFSAIISTLLMYVFFRLSFGEDASLAGAFLFNFAPYRILNIYARGALPEFFSSCFVPVILMGLFFAFKKRNIFGVFLISTGMALLTLTHPMMALVNTVVILPYFLFLLLPVQNWRYALRDVGIFSFACALGLLMTSYYTLPLSYELRFFYQGVGNKNHLAPNSYLGMQNFFTPETWTYFYQNQVGMRGQFFQVGIFETAIIIAGSLGSCFLFWKRKHINIANIFLCIGAVAVFLTLSASAFLYTHLHILGELQFPWRFLSAFILVPPVLLAYLIENTSHKRLFVFLSLLVICILRFPQLYGKNFFVAPHDSYFFTPFNLHSTNLNTIWTGETENYPVKKQQTDIIAGTGHIVSQNVSNSWREYRIEAATPLRMVDYTFYFPGWKVWVDQQPVSLEFQDVEYRGVMTYRIPQGSHDVRIRFEDTKIRFFSKILTVIGVAIFTVSLLIILKRKTIRGYELFSK